MAHVKSPGGLRVPNTTGPIIAYDVELGDDDHLIDGIFNSRSAWRVTGHSHYERCTFAGLIDHAFWTANPTDPDARITYRDLTIRGNSSGNIYLANVVPNSHAFAGEGLHFENIGSGNAYPANSSDERLMLSHLDGDPRTLVFGLDVFTQPAPNSPVKLWHRHDRPQPP